MMLFGAVATLPMNPALLPHTVITRPLATTTSRLSQRCKASSGLSRWRAELCTGKYVLHAGDYAKESSDEKYEYCGTCLIRGYPEYSKYYCTDKSYATVVSLFDTTTEASMADVTVSILTLPAAVASTSSQAAAFTSSSPPTTLSQSSSHNNVPAIVGGTVGTILGLALIGAVVFLVLQRKKHRAKESLGPKESSFKVLGSNIGEVSNSNVLGSPQVMSTASRNSPHSSFNDLNRSVSPPPHEGRYHAYSRSFNAESNIP